MLIMLFKLSFLSPIERVEDEMILLYTTDMHTSPEHIFLMLCIESDKVVDSVIGDDFVCIWYFLNVKLSNFELIGNASTST